MKKMICGIIMVVLMAIMTIPAFGDVIEETVVTEGNISEEVLVEDKTIATIVEDGVVVGQMDVYKYSDGKVEVVTFGEHCIEVVTYRNTASAYVCSGWRMLKAKCSQIAHNIKGRFAHE